MKQKEKRKEKGANKERNMKWKKNYYVAGYGM
jgi:hypothetical protein